MPDDVHSPFVSALARTGDWAALLRYWMAHGKPAAAWDAARNLLQSHTASDPAWHPVLDFVNHLGDHPLDAHTGAPEVPAGRLSGPELTTLEIAAQYPRMALCELARQMPVPLQAELFAAGIEARRTVAHRAEMALRDGPLAASASLQQAQALLECGNPGTACPVFQKAANLYRQLAEDRPAVYRPGLATTLHHLGLGLKALHRLESARDTFLEALQIRRDLAGENPGLWRPYVAGTLNNLGAVRRALNELEAAREAFVEALVIRRDLAGSHPETWRPYVAITLNNLGMVRRELNEWEPAREAHQEALAIYRELAETSPAYLAQMAGTLNNLGTVHRDLNAPEAARDAFLEALQIYRKLAAEQPTVAEPQLATTLNNLGTVRKELRDLESAKECFLEALEIRRRLAAARPEIYGTEVAATLNNLGSVRRELHNLEGAREACEEACRLYEEAAREHPHTHIPQRQRAWRNLGDLLRMRSPTLGWPDYHGARHALRKAQEAAELFRGRFASPEERKRIQGEALNIYQDLVQTCVDLFDAEGNPEALREAVTVAEAARSRGLIDLLADEELQPARAPGELVHQFHGMRRDLRQARGQLMRLEQWSQQSATTPVETPPQERAAPVPGLRRVPSSPPETPPSLTGEISPAHAQQRLHELRREVAKLESQHKDLLAEIRQQHDPDFDPDQPVRPAQWPEIPLLIPADGCAAQFFFPAGETLVLLVTREKLSRVRLPGFTAQAAMDLVDRWWDAYQEYREGRVSDAVWNQAIETILSCLSEAVMTPLVESIRKLQDVRKLILCPHQALHVFPLHACRIPPAGDRRVTDLFEVTYTASLSLLRRCRFRKRSAGGPVLLLGDPTGDLPFAALEAGAIQARYGPERVRPHLRAQAEKKAVFETAAELSQFHYTGHVCFDRAEPLQSALILQDRRERSHWLSLGEIYRELHLPQCTQVVLNGCESGMLRPDALDEYVNLPTGFLFAGATCVLSTLWAVSDVSAALLMDRYLELTSEGGMHPAAALREAQRWLREDIRNRQDLLDFALPRLLGHLPDERLRRGYRTAVESVAWNDPGSPPFAAPIYWAAFALSGLAYPLEDGEDAKPGPVSKAGASLLVRTAEPLHVARFQLAFDAKNPKPDPTMIHAFISTMTQRPELFDPDLRCRMIAWAQTDGHRATEAQAASQIEVWISPRHDLSEVVHSHFVPSLRLPGPEGLLPKPAQEDLRPTLANAIIRTFGSGQSQAPSAS